GNSFTLYQFPERRRHLSGIGVALEYQDENASCLSDVCATASTLEAAMSVRPSPGGVMPTKGALGRDQMKRKSAAFRAPKAVSLSNERSTSLMMLIPSPFLPSPRRNGQSWCPRRPTALQRAALLREPNAVLTTNMLTPDDSIVSEASPICDRDP